MVQVDVFWSYAIGASFAAASGRQLRNIEDTFQNEYFTKTLLYLAILFAPSGMVLLWAFTGWETMYYWGKAGRLLPAWIVPVFCITNITQGILGFYVAHRFIKAGKFYLAHLQWVLGYLAMFFILVHGWDGLGWRRFFTYTPHQTAEVLDMGFGPWIAIKWLVSPVALTLYAMGVIMLPVMFRWIGKWAMEGYKLGEVDVEKAQRMTVGEILRVVLRVVFVWVLGSAIVWSMLIRIFGWGYGTLVFFGLFIVISATPKWGIRKELDSVTLLPTGNIHTAGAEMPA
jgi:hypothetical protein